MLNLSSFLLICKIVINFCFKINDVYRADSIFCTYSNLISNKKKKNLTKACSEKLLIKIK